MEFRFYRCDECGQIVAIVRNEDAPMYCGCRRSDGRIVPMMMKELLPGTVDSSKKKHVPVFTVTGNTVYVEVGSSPHPMKEQHYIEWIAVQTREGNQRKTLSPSQEPSACFALCDGDEVLAVYAYCNLHGLWKASANGSSADR